MWLFIENTIENVNLNIISVYIVNTGYTIQLV